MLREPFAPAFTDSADCVAPYLILLNLGAPAERQQALRVVAGCEASDDDIVALLAEDNWRPHVVACAATLLRGDPSPALLAALWQRIIGWSWTSPQVAATLSIADPEFAARSLQLLEQGALPGKSAAALLGLLAEVPALAEATAQLRGTPHVARLLAEDYDRSPEIATSWRRAITEALREYR